MFDINDFVATMNDVVLNAEENDIGMWELVDIAANYIDEKLRGENKMKKVYDLKEKGAFIKEVEAKIFESLDGDMEWLDENDIVITVDNVSVTLPINADNWNEIDFALKECYEVDYGNLGQTTGNTKITSEVLIHHALIKEVQYAKDNGSDIDKVCQRYINACKDELVLSDIAEYIRIENDLRGSEVQCLYNDFKSGRLVDVIKNEVKKYRTSKLEKDERGLWHYTSKNGIVYDINEASADVNIITDVYQDYWKEDADVYFHYKLVDFVCGCLETDADDIKDFLDDRVDFYEKHERTIKFLGADNKLHKSYVGTEAPQEWNEAEEVSVDDMKKMFGN